jgi:hypothetical protein
MKQGKDAERELASFLAKYSAEIAERAETILGEMRKLYPTATELVYDNYNALAIGFSPTERPSDGIFSIALYPKWVSLFFLQSKGLPDPDRLLKGSGTVAKHIVLPSANSLHLPEVQELMRDAAVRAKKPFDPKGERKIIIRSVSAKQRPRRPSEGDDAPAARSATRSKAKKVSVTAHS